MRGNFNRLICYKNELLWEVLWGEGYYWNMMLLLNTLMVLKKLSVEIIKEHLIELK